MFAGLDDERASLIIGHTGDLGQLVHSEVGQVVTGVNACFRELVDQLRRQAFQTLEAFRQGFDFFFLGDFHGQQRVLGTGAQLVDRVFVEEGEYVTPGQRLLLVHDPKKVWIDANVKETDIRKVKIGQTVDVTVDAFPDKKFAGKVTAIGNAATSEFALLPTPNPSGNFTKITQRLRVRVAIDQEQNLLRPGMMVEVFIDVR